MSPRVIAARMAACSSLEGHFSCTPASTKFSGQRKNTADEIQKNKVKIVIF